GRAPRDRPAPEGRDSETGRAPGALARPTPRPAHQCAGPVAPWTVRPSRYWSGSTTGGFWAEDIVQDAFLAAFENLARFDVRRDFGRWLRGIARIKYLERARRRRETPVESAILDEIERRHAEWDRTRFEEGGDVFAALKRCLDRLSELARKTVDSFYMRRLSCAAIAKTLATSEVAVRKRLERARESLGRCIRRELGPGGAD
ncbi:MAG: sigma-70 family RNA polymerase sigma factor, partial [Planctomycetota bacterium]